MMAVLASAAVTLCTVRDVKATYRFYKLQSSTAAVPAIPTSISPIPPSGWTLTEPSYTEGSTNSLYTVDLTIFTDDTFNYSSVSLSSSYEAAKVAYNKALAASNSVTTLSTRTSTLENTVNGLNSTVSSNTTTLSQKADGSTVTTLDSKVTSLQTSVDGINLEVSKKVGTSEIISKINQSAEGISISANKINLAGAVTISALDSSLKTTIDTTSSTASTALTNANKAQASVDGLEVGGRNLFSKSNIAKDIDSTKDFSLNGWAATFMNNQNVLRTLEEGKTYTLSYDVELIERTNVPDLQYYQVGLSLHSPSTANDVIFFGNVRELNDKVRVEKTFVCPPLSDQIFLYYTNRYTTGGSNPRGFDTIKITNLKLEKGNKPTDWTPAPEDVDVSIYSADHKADEAKFVLDSLSKNLCENYTNTSTMNATFEDIRQDLSAASIANWCWQNNLTYIDGGKIYAKSVTSRAIDVDNLSAISANLGTVTTGVIQSPNYASGGDGVELDFRDSNNNGLSVRSNTKNTMLKIDADGTRVYSNRDLQNPVAQFVDTGVDVNHVNANSAIIAGMQITKVGSEVWITSII